jgi:hypothetical protein
MIFSGGKPTPNSLAAPAWWGATGTKEMKAVRLQQNSVHCKYDIPLLSLAHDMSG